MKLNMVKNRSLLLLFGVWLGWALLMLLPAANSVDQLMTDPDDFMRMVQVKDWLAGQSWFDVTQYRIHPPEGGLMHWSRLLDVPIASVLLLSSLIVTPQTADLVAITAIPLILFGCLIMLVFGTVKQMADEKIALLAAFLLPTYPLIIRQFLPGRIDHHSWQILMAAITLFAFFNISSKKSPYIMGGAIAFWMHVSIEGLPYAVIFGIILTIFYLFPKLSNNCRNNDSRLIAYLNSLSVFSVAFFVLTQSLTNISIAYCDAVSWPLLASMILISAGTNVAHLLLKNQSITIRMVAIGSVGIAGIVFFLTFSSSCALNPFGQLSPLVQRFWHESISEGLPITRQAAAIVSLLLFVPLIFSVWIVYLVRQKPVDYDRKKWFSLAFLVFCTSLLSFKIQRTAGVAELFALPGLAALTAVIVYRIQMSKIMMVRVIATVAVIAVLAPMTSFVAGSVLSADRTTETTLSKIPNNKRNCSVDELRILEPGIIFTTMAVGPEILYKTQHSVFASGYHRNNIIMHRLIATMLGSTNDAYQTLSDANVRYVVFCPTHFEAQSYLRASKRGFASGLMADRNASWLQPVPAFANSKMRVFRFHKVGQ